MSSNTTADLLININPMACCNSRLKMLNRAVTSIYDEAFKPFGLTGNQFTLLTLIGKMQSTNQKTIADMLMINFSTVSRDVVKLDSAGWVIIDKGTDARNTAISLSAKGLAVLTSVLAIWSKTNAKVQQMLGTGSSANIDKMITSLKKSK